MIKLRFGIIMLLCLLSVIDIPAQDIFDAVKGNDLTKTKMLIEKDNSTLKLKDQTGNTPLHYAAIVGSVPMADYLILKGADVNAVNTQLNTPLHESIVNKNSEVAKLLIKKGSNPNSRNTLGIMPLHMAGRNGMKEIVEFLIDAGADIDGETNAKLTPLHFNILMQDNTEIVEFLISRGAKINTPNHLGDYPLNTAAYHGSVEMINLLMDNNADYDTSGVHGINTILTSAAKGSVRLFKSVSERMGYSYFKNKRYLDLVVRNAFAGGSLKIVNILLSKGAEINLSPDDNGWNYLHYAAENNHPAIIEFLAEKGADINARTKSGKSPYNIADEKGNKELLKLIKKLGGNPEPQKFPVLTGSYMGQIPPDNGFKKFIPDIIFTNHSSIAVSPDGNEIYWAVDSLMYETKIVNGRWIKPQVASFSGKKDYKDDVPFITPDNKKLFFTSIRPLGTIKGKENIWYTERTANGWSAPKPVSASVNALSIHWQISVSNDGTLYFAGNKTGVRSVFYSKLENGEYSEPESLMVDGKPLDGKCPYIAPDESYLIFATLVQGKTKLNITYKSKNNEWLTPRELPINAYGPEVIVSPDQKYLFNRSNWMSAKFIEELKPKE